MVGLNLAPENTSDIENMQTATLVIFDCDGVLVDSERLSHAVLHEMLNEMGATISLEETVVRFIGTSMPTCIERIGVLLGRPAPRDFRSDFAGRTKAAFLAGLKTVAGVEEVLSSMATPFCVASNGNRAKVDFTLGHTGLLSRFAERVFTADQVDRPKPAPDLFLYAASCLNAVPSRVVVVEDTPTGIIAAKAAGMYAIGFASLTPTSCLLEAGANVVVNDMPALQARLAAW